MPPMTPSASNYHDTRFTYDRKRTRVWTEIARYLQEKYIDPAGRILELGAGYCEFINAIRGSAKHALDTFPELSRYAASEVRPHVQSCTSLSLFADGSIDTVFASNLFEHLTRQELDVTLREIRRILSKGGKLIVLQPNFKYCYRDYFDDYTHIQIFTHVGLADLLQSHGFSITTVVPRFLPFSMKTRLPVFAPILRLYLRSPVKPMACQMLAVATNPAGA